jgi:hypothetical protein
MSQKSMDPPTGFIEVNEIKDITSFLKSVRCGKRCKVTKSLIFDVILDRLERQLALLSSRLSRWHHILELSQPEHGQLPSRPVLEPT